MSQEPAEENKKENYNSAKAPQADLSPEENKNENKEQDFNPVKAIIMVVQSMVVLKIGIVHFGSKMAAEGELFDIIGFSLCILWSISSMVFFAVKPK